MCVGKVLLGVVALSVAGGGEVQTSSYVEKKIQSANEEGKTSIVARKT